MIGELINKFEETTQTVAEFNALFDCCPLTGNFASDALVEIGSIAGPDCVRHVTVSQMNPFSIIEFRHEFVGPDEWMLKNKGRIYFSDSNGSTNLKSITNTDTEDNTEMSPEEMKLKPTNYFMLQYFRGCISPYHTISEISRNLDSTTKTVRTYLDEMQKNGIITVERNKLCLKVEICEQWRKLC